MLIKVVEYEKIEATGDSKTIGKAVLYFPQIACYVRANIVRSKSGWFACAPARSIDSPNGSKKEYLPFWWIEKALDREFQDLVHQAVSDFLKATKNQSTDIEAKKIQREEEFDRMCQRIQN